MGAPYLYGLIAGGDPERFVNDGDVDGAAAARVPPLGWDAQ